MVCIRLLTIDSGQELLPQLLGDLTLVVIARVVDEVLLVMTVVRLETVESDLHHEEVPDHHLQVVGDESSLLVRTTVSHERTAAAIGITMTEDDREAQATEIEIGREMVAMTEEMIERDVTTVTSAMNVPTATTEKV